MKQGIGDTSRACVSCTSRSCEKGDLKQIRTCERGVAYFRADDAIHRLDEPLPLRTLAQNLKHETHKFLQLIVNEACEINPGVSTKSVDLNDPASRIVAATVLVNDFIDMIAGVNDFSPPDGAFASRQSGHIKRMVDKSIKAQSMIKNARRCSRLVFVQNFDEPEMSVVTGAKAIENIVSIMIDNVYKYSVEGTTVDIRVSRDERGFGFVEITNICYNLVDSDRAFDKGYQANPNSDGFGYGLHWASTIVSYMNEQLETNIALDLISTMAKDGLAMCVVRLKGLPCG